MRSVVRLILLVPRVSRDRNLTSLLHPPLSRAKSGECDANPMFMRDSCYRSCKVCGGGPGRASREEL